MIVKEQLKQARVDLVRAFEQSHQRGHAQTKIPLRVFQWFVVLFHFSFLWLFCEI